MYRLGNRILHAGNKLVYSYGIPDYAYIYAMSASGYIDKVRLDDFSVVLTSADLGTPLYYSLNYDTYNTNYLYFSDTTKIYKVNASDLTIAASSGTMPDVFQYIIIDNDFLYCRDWNLGNVYKINKSDLTIALTSPVSFSAGYGNTHDNDYIYIGSAALVQKCKKSDLSRTANSNGASQMAAVDDNYVYVSSSNNLKKYNKFSLSLEASWIQSSSNCYEIIPQDDNYLYWSTAGNNKRLNKSDLKPNLDVNSIAGGDAYYNLIIGDFLYVITSTNYIHKYNLSDLTYVSSVKLSFSVYFKIVAGYK